MKSELRRKLPQLNFWLGMTYFKLFLILSVSFQRMVSRSVVTQLHLNVPSEVLPSMVKTCLETTVFSGCGKSSRKKRQMVKYILRYITFYFGYCVLESNRCFGHKSVELTAVQDICCCIAVIFLVNIFQFYQNVSGHEPTATDIESCNIYAFFSLCSTFY